MKVNEEVANKGVAFKKRGIDGLVLAGTNVQTFGQRGRSVPNHLSSTAPMPAAGT